MKQYVLTDIHGCFKTFEKMLDNIGFTKEDELILLGDYIDRGPGSANIIDKIIKLQSDGYNLKCLTGNHEQMMVSAFRNPLESVFWINNGGKAVLDELGLLSVKQLPQKYIDFVDSLKYYHDTDDYIFVHAGLNLRLENPLDDKESLIWIRKWENHEILETYLQGKKVVHGHTPQTRTEIEKRFELFNQDYHPVLNIDNGCVFKHNGYNNLCCYNITDNKLIFQKNIDN